LSSLSGHVDNRDLIVQYPSGTVCSMQPVTPYAMIIVSYVLRGCLCIWAPNLGTAIYAHAHSFYHHLLDQVLYHLTIIPPTSPWINIKRTRTLTDRQPYNYHPHGSLPLSFCTLHSITSASRLTNFDKKMHIQRSRPSILDRGPYLQAIYRRQAVPSCS